jgi:hypothetical protein
VSRHLEAMLLFTCCLLCSYHIVPHEVFSLTHPDDIKLAETAQARSLCGLHRSQCGLVLASEWCNNALPLKFCHRRGLPQRHMVVRLLNVACSDGEFAAVLDSSLVQPRNLQAELSAFHNQVPNGAVCVGDFDDS